MGSSQKLPPAHVFGAHTPVRPYRVLPYVHVQPMGPVAHALPRGSTYVRVPCTCVSMRTCRVNRFIFSVLLWAMASTSMASCVLRTAPLATPSRFEEVHTNEFVPIDEPHEKRINIKLFLDHSSHLFQRGKLIDAVLSIIIRFYVQSHGHPPSTWNLGDFNGILTITPWLSKSLHGTKTS